MSELAKRVLTASILAPLAIWWLIFSPSPWFEVLLGVLSVAALFELIIMLSLPKRAMFIFSGAAACILILLTQQAIAAILLLGIIWLGLFMLAVRPLTDIPVAEQTFRFGLAYWLAVWLLIFIWVLSTLHHQPSGHIFMLGAFLSVWAADIGAYFAGRAFGRHKLCVPISPGKTIEGAVAGALCGIAVAAWIWTTFAGLELIAAIFIGLALVLTAILGDLGESAIKRAVGVKDSGRLLPGHGGLLDRIDALIPAVAVAGVLYMTLLSGAGA
jgi:phosphatidate cytidylyltransferase